jgi:hypothetical protein
MKPEYHLTSFEERKDTIFRWAIDVRGLENSQRIIGDNASRAVCDLLSAYLHKTKKVEDGFQLNHAWFKSPNVAARLPEFNKKETLVQQMIELEQLCEKLSYGAPKPIEKAQRAIDIFNKLEKELKEMLQ